MSIAMENLWLETDAQGLGGDVLNIPDHLRAFAIFPYGYPAESREQQNRYDDADIYMNWLNTTRYLLMGYPLTGNVRIVDSQRKDLIKPEK